MSSKFTKATEPPGTLPRWWSMVRAVNTDSASAAYSLQKSTVLEIAVCERLKSSQWKILCHNVSVMHVQVDILARSPSGLLNLIEVKSNTDVLHLSWSQRRRLFRAAAFLSSFEPVELQVAVIRRGHVTLLPVDGV